MEKKRDSGIEFLGKITWGTHFCQFYETREDLVELLVPYFKAGLENNEFCMWVTSEPLNVEDVIMIMSNRIQNFDQYINKGQIEILPYTKWYLIDNAFRYQEVLNGWIEKLEKALDNGFDGLRLTGNTFWLEKTNLWSDFSHYENEINNVIGNYKMIAMCTYSLSQCSINEILDVMNTHQFAFLKHKDSWRIIENYHYKETRQVLKDEIILRKQVEEQLNITNKKISEILASIQDGFFTLDRNWNFVYVNKRVADSLGLKPHDLIGYNIWEKFPGLLGTSYDTFYHKVMEHSQKQQFEAKSLITNNWYHITVYPSLDGISVYWQNITDRKLTENELLKNEQRLKSLAENIPSVLMRYDNEFRVLYLSHKSEEYTNIPVDEFIGKTNREVGMPEHLCDLWENAISKVFQTGQYQTLEFDLDSEKGTKSFYLKLAPELSQDGTVEYVLGISTEITELKQVKQKLEQFVSNISHELRTPLSILTMSINNFKKMAESISSEIKKKLLDAISLNIRFINDLMESLLTLSRIDENRINLDIVEINLLEVIKEILSIHNPQIIEKKMQIFTQIDSDLKLRGDHDKLKEIFLILLDNAIKYSPNNSKIEINVIENYNYTNDSESINGTLIEFIDQGIGIKSEDLPRLFERFFRSIDVMNIKGTGLGLSIANELIKAHHGKILVDTEFGKGSTFSVLIPLK